MNNQEIFMNHQLFSNLKMPKNVDIVKNTKKLVATVVNNFET